MKRLRWWKTVELTNDDGPFGASIDLCPEQSITSKMGLFDNIVEAVKAAGFSYELTEETETVLARRK